MCEGRKEHEFDCSSAVVVSVRHAKERKLSISRANPEPTRMNLSLFIIFTLHFPRNRA